MDINTKFNSMFSSGNNSVDNIFILIKDRYMKKIQTTLITAMTLLLMCSASWAATYYVDGRNGNDTNAGSQSAPWKTIGKANNILKAGDTVFIKKGTYKQTIRPNNSGSRGNYITYSRYSKDEVVITGVDAADLHDRSYVFIDGLKFLNVEHFVQLEPNGQHNIIQNCHMEEGGQYRGINLDKNANYNKILNNIIIGKCAPHDLIVIQSSNHNLIEGNVMYYGSHNAIRVHDVNDGSTGYNIIRNNYIQNRWHSSIGIFGVEYILVENNTIVDAGEDSADNTCGSDRDRNSSKDEKKGIQLGAQYSIVRNNVLVNNGYGVGLASSASSEKYPWKNNCINNRIYHNTLTKNHVGIRHNSIDPATDNVIKNNMLYNNRDYSIKVQPFDKNYFISNNIIGASVRYSPMDIIIDNISINPLFVDENDRDFMLKIGSQMINKGAFLTKTVNSGSGKTIVVEDARYFIDGWGIFEGDLIQIEEQTQTARITSVDYKTNTITINSSLTWAKGKGVSLPYHGSSPDIGAFEFDEANVDMLLPPYNLRVSFN
jgi:hypothetical protein